MTSDEIVNLLRNTCQYEAATLIESQTSEIKELRNSLSLAISKFPEIANSVADFTNKQRSHSPACGD